MRWISLIVTLVVAITGLTICGSLLLNMANCPLIHWNTLVPYGIVDGTVFHNGFEYSACKDGKRTASVEDVSIDKLTCSDSFFPYFADSMRGITSGKHPACYGVAIDLFRLGTLFSTSLSDITRSKKFGASFLLGGTSWNIDQNTLAFTTVYAVIGLIVVLYDYFQLPENLGSVISGNFWQSTKKRGRPPGVASLTQAEKTALLKRLGATGSKKQEAAAKRTRTSTGQFTAEG